MLALRSAREAYRLVDLDARIAGSSPAGLVGVCFERFDIAIGQALAAEAKGDNLEKSRSLTGALAALTALEMGLDAANPLAPALGRIYRAARAALLDAALAFDAGALTAIRRDFADIAMAMAGPAGANA